MERMYRKRIYKVNGDIIKTNRFYNGYISELKWCITKPTGELYASYNSFNEACEKARSLKRGE